MRESLGKGDPSIMSPTAAIVIVDGSGVGDGAASVVTIGEI
jgi:hypothetical protein